MKKIFVVCLLLGFVSASMAVSIGERVSVPSKILGKPHELLIYTPPSYDYSQQQRFPVLYIVDGDYNFHYLTGLIELWSNISAFMPEMVVVGISGGDTASYRSLVKLPLNPASGDSDAGRAGMMLDAMKAEIMPHVNAHFRTNNFNVLGGHSIGGLFVTYAAIHQPALFDRFIAVSPSLWWQGGIMKDHVAGYLKDNPEVKSQLYITLANEQGMGVHGFIEMLQAQRRGDFKYQFKQFPDETHGSVGLASYQWAMFDIFKASRLSERYFESPAAVSDYAKSLTQAYGRVMPIPSGFLRNSCYAWCGDAKMRVEIDAALAADFPSDVAFFRVLVAEHLIGKADLKSAEKWLNQAQESSPDYVALHHAWYKLHKQTGDKKKAQKAKDKLTALLAKQNIRQWQRNELMAD